MLVAQVERIAHIGAVAVAVVPLLLVVTLFASNYSLLVFATVDLSAFRDLMLILLTVTGLLALLMALVWRWEK